MIDDADSETVSESSGNHTYEPGEEENPSGRYGGERNSPFSGGEGEEGEGGDGDEVAQEGSGSEAPWYDDSWWDNLNPYAWYVARNESAKAFGAAAGETSQMGHHLDSNRKLLLSNQGRMANETAAGVDGKWHVDEFKNQHKADAETMRLLKLLFEVGIEANAFMLGGGLLNGGGTLDDFVGFLDEFGDYLATRSAKKPDGYLDSIGSWFSRSPRAGSPLKEAAKQEMMDQIRKKGGFELIFNDKLLEDLAIVELKKRFPKMSEAELRAEAKLVNGLFGLDNKGVPRIVLRSDARRTELMHEWIHYLHFKKLKFSKEAWDKLSIPEKEAFVTDYFQRYKKWWDSLSEYEKNAIFRNPDLPDGYDYGLHLRRGRRLPPAGP